MGHIPESIRRLALLLLVASLIGNVWLIYLLYRDTVLDATKIHISSRSSKSGKAITIRKKVIPEVVLGPPGTAPLSSGYVRIDAARVHRNCSLSDNGLSLSRNLLDYLQIDSSEAAALDQIGRNCVSEIKRIELATMELRTDDSGSYYLVPSCAEQIDRMLHGIRRELHQLVGDTAGETIYSLIRSDQWIADASRDRKIGFSLDSTDELYFDYGDSAVRLPAEVRLGRKPVGIPQTLLDRTAHLLNFHEMLQIAPLPGKLPVDSNGTVTQPGD